MGGWVNIQLARETGDAPERVRERQRERDRERETDRHTHTHTQTHRERHRETERKRKTLIFKGSSIMSIWTSLTASPCYCTNTKAARIDNRLVQLYLQICIFR